MSPDEGGHNPPPSVREVSGLLREMKRRKELRFSDISAATGLSVSALTAACQGKHLPTWRVVLAFAQACHGDEEDEQDEEAVREVYARACAAVGRKPPPRAAVELPDPAQATTAAEFVGCLRLVLLWAGSPSLRVLNVRSNGHLPPSTVSEALSRDRLPRPELLAAFLRACRVPADQVGAWEETRKRLANDLSEGKLETQP